MLRDFSTEDLEGELERRKQIQKEKEKPIALPSVNFKPLIEACRRYIDDLDNNGYVDDDDSHYIFEKAMTCIFGDGVWEWINKSRS